VRLTTQMRNATLMLAIGVVLLLPLLLAEYPPLGDYPNHMARAWILLHYDQSPFFQSLVALNPHLVPNLGFEALILPLAKVMPFMMAGRVTVGIILVSHLLACVLLARTVTPGNSWHGLVVGLMAIHGGIQSGFLSFSWGIAWSFAALACWIRWDRGDGARWGAFTAGLALVSGLIHATAPVTLVAAVGATIGVDFLTRKRDFFSSLTRSLTVVPAVIGFLVLRRSVEIGDGDPLRWNTVSGKLAALMTWSRTYDLTFDLVWLAAFTALVGSAVYLTRLRGMHRNLLTASSALWLLALLMPVAVMTGSGADARFVPPAAALTLLALAPMIHHAGKVMVAVAVALVVARQGAIANRWADLSIETGRIVNLLTVPPPNSLLLQCTTRITDGIDAGKNAMPFRHVGHYLTVMNDGISRYIFGFATQQPIIVSNKGLDRAAGATSRDCADPTWPWVLVDNTGSVWQPPVGYSLRGTDAEWQIWERNQRSPVTDRWSPQ